MKKQYIAPSIDTLLSVTLDTSICKWSRQCNKYYLGNGQEKENSDKWGYINRPGTTAPGQMKKVTGDWNGWDDDEGTL